MITTQFANFSIHQFTFSNNMLVSEASDLGLRSAPTTVLIQGVRSMQRFYCSETRRDAQADDIVAWVYRSPDFPTLSVHILND